MKHESSQTTRTQVVTDFRTRCTAETSIVYVTQCVIIAALTISVCVIGCKRDQDNEYSQRVLALEVLNQNVDGLGADALKDDYFKEYYVPAHRRAISYLRTVSDKDAKRPYPILAVVTQRDEARGLLLVWYQKGSSAECREVKRNSIAQMR